VLPSLPPHERAARRRPHLARPQVRRPLRASWPRRCPGSMWRRGGALWQWPRARPPRRRPTTRQHGGGSGICQEHRVLPTLEALSSRRQDKCLSPRSFNSYCSVSLSPLLGFKP
jgi:hypothetical protein